MSTTFEIGVSTTKDILLKQPPQYRHLNVVYTVFSSRVGSAWFPAECWCDFAGIWLFRWYEAVWKMSERQTRAARLPFLHTYEIWLRRTATHWWKASRVERYAGSNIIKEEVLVIPEQVEAALLTAGNRLLRGALEAGRWTEDCIALEALLHDTKAYLQALNSGTVPVPRFLTPQFVIPMG